MRWSIMITTFLAIICHITRHYFRMVWGGKYKKQRERNIYTYYNETFFGEQQTKAQLFSDLSYKDMTYIHIQFVVELLILCICPLPFFECWIDQTFLMANEISEIGENKIIYHFLSDYILVLMFSRIVFLIRSLFNYSKYRDEYSKMICR